MSTAPSTRPFRKGTLAAVVGAVAAIGLLTATPRLESGRKVEVSLAADGTATVKHVGGKQYLDAYLDIVGVPTACDGITRGVKMGQRYTPAQCAAMLENELVRHADAIMVCTPSLRAPGRDQQRLAAVLLAYNIGPPAWCGSTARKRFDAGDFKGGCDAFLAWHKVRLNGVLTPSAGLAARRREERMICRHGL